MLLPRSGIYAPGKQNVSFAESERERDVDAFLILLSPSCSSPLLLPSGKAPQFGFAAKDVVVVAVSDIRC